MKNFLNFAKNKVDLLRLNMSHIEIKNLKKTINFIRSYTKTPICIDTEGAQIRTKVKISKFFKTGQKFKIYNHSNTINLYPQEIYYKLKNNDVLNIGFEDLKAKIIQKNIRYITLKVLSSGKIDNNKGVHIENRNINLNFLTKKDLQALEISKKLKIKNYALSFTNSYNDILKFNKLLPKANKIFKIESKKAIRSIDKIIKFGTNFLIDRGDLSKEISIENIPFVQRKILKVSRKFRNKNIYIATNFLESMILNKYPTRGEANDIYNSLEMGAKGLVLAAETAIGKYPEKTVNFLKKMINSFKKQN
jgi:pyruvate kinase